ncbi:hypothetical protein H0H92_015209 [Tricholoma furcatifolium]|nr:hypothetical protein H0H92_015209 [Tricholoma furcatifolium]
MASKKIILIYISTRLTAEEKQALFNKFTHPQRPIGKNPCSYDFADSSVPQVGSDVEGIVASHKASRLAGGDEIEESVIIVADEGVSPSSHPQTVLLVKIFNGAERPRSSSPGGHGHDFQTIRVLVSNAAGVLATIASGQYGWEEYWKVAKANGGHFPGE